jgi:predicted ATPase
MLERFEIRNYRCLKEVSVPLRPLTVLLGPNDSGKSAFLQAVLTLANRKISFDREEHWRLTTENTIKLSGTINGNEFLVDEESIRKQGMQTVSEHVSEIRPVQRFVLPASGVKMTSQGFGESPANLSIGADGEQVAAVLDHLLRRDRQRFFRLRDALRELVPGLEEIDIETPKPELRRVDLVIENGLRIPANLASSGVRLLLFFATLAYLPDPPRTILIEEPENGIHPKRLADVVRLLREITEGKHGDHAAQVILTTHSPYLLDCIDVDRDQVLVFQRNQDGSRSAQPADAVRLKNYLDEFLLGEVWFNESEEGLISRPT